MFFPGNQANALSGHDLLHHEVVQLILFEGRGAQVAQDRKVGLLASVVSDIDFFFNLNNSDDDLTSSAENRFLLNDSGEREQQQRCKKPGMKIPTKDSNWAVDNRSELMRISRIISATSVHWAGPRGRITRIRPWPRTSSRGRGAIL